MASYLYDVAFSFAEQDRKYVRKMVEFLRYKNLKVFYDEYEQVNIWGKERISFIEDVYINQARHVAMFVSKSYLADDWCKHERTCALNKSIKKSEYVLPIRLDDTKLPGLHDTIYYLDARNLSVPEIGHMLLLKLGKEIKIEMTPVWLLYRFGKKQYSGNKTTSKMGSRWTRQGEEVFYTSTSLALAALESMVHFSKPQKDFCFTQYTLPIDQEIETVLVSELGHDWNELHNFHTTQEIGSKWYQTGKVGILSIPSAIMPGERNFLFNANHTSFAHLNVNKVEEFELDPRFFK